MPHLNPEKDKPINALKPGESSRLRGKLLRKTEGLPWSQWSARLIDLVGSIPRSRAQSELGTSHLAGALAIGKSPFELANEVLTLTKDRREAVDALWELLGGDDGA